MSFYEFYFELVKLTRKVNYEHGIFSDTNIHRRVIVKFEEVITIHIWSYDVNLNKAYIGSNGKFYKNNNGCMHILYEFEDYKLNEDKSFYIENVEKTINSINKLKYNCN